MLNGEKIILKLEKKMKSITIYSRVYQFYKYAGNKMYICISMI